MVELSQRDLAMDVLAKPRQLVRVVQIARSAPRGLRIVLNHLGSPPFANASQVAEWRAGIAELGQLPNVFCKVSGTPREVWTDADVRPFVSHVVASFGARALFAGNWFVVAEHSSYAHWAAAVAALLVNSSSKNSAAGARALLSSAAARAYNLPLKGDDGAPASGTVQLAPIFADGFVLQDYYMFDSRSLVFGGAAPGELVRLNLTHDANRSVSKQYEALADAASGQWIAQIDPDYFNLDPATSGQAPNIGSRTLTLTVAGSSDRFASVQTVAGVRYGDVFVCAGGSEQARPLSASVDGQSLLKAARSSANLLRSVRVFNGSAWISAADMPPEDLARLSAACVFTALALPRLNGIYAQNRTVPTIHFIRDLL